MKKILLIIGIVAIVACILALAYAALNMFGYYSVLDGSSELYVRLHQRAITFFVVGIVLAVIGIVCMIVRRGR